MGLATVGHAGSLPRHCVAVMPKPLRLIGMRSSEIVLWEKLEQRFSYR
jgi:hypothetical protein